MYNCLLLVYLVETFVEFDFFIYSRNIEASSTIQNLSTINLESWSLGSSMSFDIRRYPMFFSMFFFQDYVLIQLSCGQTARLPRELLDFEAFPGDELMDLVVTHVSPQGAATRSEVAIMRPKREKIFG